MDIDSLDEAQVKVPATDEFWQEVAAHPAFSQDIDCSQEISPAFAGLQSLKYESENPCANALSYKEEGNYHYARKEFKKAITSYTGGLVIKAPDATLNAILYTNRAIAHYYLKNYGSCLRDCKAAIKLDPSHLKAYIKGAQAALNLGKTEETLQFCCSGLELCPNHTELNEMQLKALRLQIQQATLDTETQAKSTKQLQQKELVRQLLMERGIRINSKLPPIELPGAAKPTFFVDSAGRLHWSVLFMYPECGQTDFLQDVVETTRVIDCLRLVFNPDQAPPAWDPQRAYRVDNDSLEVYFEDTLVKDKLVSFSPNLTLEKLSKRKDYCVRDDLIICLHVISKVSEKFYKRWKAELF